jgi:4-amino-4-deoxy-L-arabinose transferase-like glycosyltransferase
VPPREDPSAAGATGLAEGTPAARHPNTGPGSAADRAARRRERALLIVIVALGLFLRLHDYTQAPRLADNDDELAWTWAGMSLWQDHSPTSWSYLRAYPHVFPIPEPDNGKPLPGVHPWLDHPPLFALLIGGYALLAGETKFSDVSVAVIRLPVIALSLVTLLIGYLLGRRVLGEWPALIAAALFAVTPAAVLSSREVESEALLAPMLMASLLILHRLLREEAAPWEPWVLLLMCALAPLIKVPGACLAVIVAVVLAVHGRWRLAGLSVALSCLGLLAYAVYGIVIDWQRFAAVIALQASRHSTLLSGYQFITAPAFTDRIRLRDGWWLLGWMALAAVASMQRHRRADLLIAWPVVAFTGAVMLLADPSATERFGWYRFPVYPLVLLAAGHLVVAAVRRPALVPVALLIALPGATATLAWPPGSGALNPPFPLSMALVAVLVAACVSARTALRRKDGTSIAWPQLAVAAAVGAMLVLDVVQSFRLADVYTSL